MTTICWTVIHHAAAPVARGAAKIARVAHHIIRRSVHHGAQAAYHGSGVVTHPRVWFELVCKVVPAAVAGGGLLIPHPAGLLPGHEPPGLIQPAPPGGLIQPLPPGLTQPLPSELPAVLPPGVPWGWVIPPDIPSPPYYAPPTNTEVIEYPPPPGPSIIEPSTGRLLLTALAGLLFARFAVRHVRVARGER